MRGVATSLKLVLVALLLAIVIGPAAAQSDLVAALEVLNAGVEVRRVDTANWVPVKVETLIGPGDAIRTNGTGRVRVTFFSDGTSVNIEPRTEYRLVEFTGNEQSFRLTVEILVGITRQQFARLVAPESSYRVITPGAEMTVRGTDFSIRVEESGRSSVLTFDGLVEAVGGRDNAAVPPGFGLRAVAASLSDVVPATTFAELDAALDGCPGSFTTNADVRLNVRVGPGTSFNRVGTIAPEEISNLIGIDPSGAWYRIPFRDGYGWVLAEAMRVTVGDGCVALAQYPTTHSEDIARYSLVGELEVNAFVRVETGNVRSGPGLNFERTGQLEQGTELIITGRNADSSWFRVRTLDGLTGWMAGFLIQVETDIAQIGVVPLEEVPAEPEPTPAPTVSPTPEGDLDPGAGA